MNILVHIFRLRIETTDARAKRTRINSEESMHSRFSLQQRTCSLNFQQSEHGILPQGPEASRLLRVWTVTWLAES